MRYLTVILLYMIFATVPSFAAQGTDGEQLEKKAELSIVGKNWCDTSKDFCFKLGEDLQIRASGDFVTKINTEWEQTESLKLYFDDVMIAVMETLPERGETDEDLLLTFTLVRDANDSASRIAWNSFFKKKHGYLMDVKPSIALGNKLWVAESSEDLKFYIAIFTT